MWGLSCFSIDVESDDGRHSFYAERAVVPTYTMERLLERLLR